MKNTPKNTDNLCHLYTDGAASGNPGPGGWGAVLISKNEVEELGGAEPATTNNRMEIMAAIEGLAALARKSIHSRVLVYSDSSYLLKGIREWMPIWQARGWTRADGGEVANQDLWRKLSQVLAQISGKIEVNWQYVPGHAGVPGNERADQIAVAFSQGRSISLFSGSADQYPIDLTPPDLQSAAAQKKKRNKGRPGKGLAYLSLVGGMARRHATWEECERAVKGRTGAKYKKAMDESEVDSILAAWGLSRSDLK